MGCPNVDSEQVYQSIPGNLTFLQSCAAALVGQSMLTVHIGAAHPDYLRTGRLIACPRGQRKGAVRIAGFFGSGGRLIIVQLAVGVPGGVQQAEL